MDEWIAAIESNVHSSSMDRLLNRENSVRRSLPPSRVHFAECAIPFLLGGKQDDEEED
jgi:hypothetical protein